MLVGTGTNKTQGRTVLLCAAPHQALNFHLTQGFRHAVQRFDPKGLGDFFEQAIDVLDAYGLEHLTNVGFVMGNKRHI